VGHSEEYIDEQGYMTPRDPYILAVEKVFGGHICLDPASDQLANMHGVQASYYYAGQPNDGLKLTWDRHAAYVNGYRGQWDYSENRWTVFLNPPYGRLHGKTGPFNVELWSSRIVMEYAAGAFDEGILLVNSFTGAKWFKKLWHYPICFTDHRINFINPATLEPDKQPRYYNAFVYFGHRIDRFASAFSDIGIVVTAATPPVLQEGVLNER
jgi:hypothetical protein